MLDIEEVIGRFHEKFIKDKYPHISLEEVNLICRSPFVYLAKQMADPSLPSVRFKYWGIFKAKAKRIAAVATYIERSIETGSKTTPLSNAQKRMLEHNNNLKSQNDEK